MFVCNNMNYENICLKYMNYEKHEIFVCNTWIMKTWIYYFAIHYENFSLQNMNFENMKIFVCNTWIMKIFVGITLIMKKIKFVRNTWIMKTFICNTWIMKTGNICIIWIMKTLKCLFAVHELWKYLLALH